MRAPVASCRRNVIKVTAVLGAQQLAASSKLIWEPVVDQLAHIYLVLSGAAAAWLGMDFLRAGGRPVCPTFTWC